MAKLWDKEITVDEQISLLEDFSSYLEVSMLVTIEKFKSIIIIQKAGWLNDARDFLTDTLPDICDEVGEYLIKSRLMNPPNWKIFLKDRMEIATEAGRLIYSYHEDCCNSCISQYQMQYQATYEQQLARQEGLGFGIISNSLAAHLVYAAQSARKDIENEKKAQEATDKIMHASSPIERAAQMTIAFYHKTFDPFVVDFLVSFYSDLEKLIYDGLDISKEELDNNKTLSENELSSISGENHRECITASLSKYPFNGNALFWAIKYDDAGDELIEFCSANPLVLPKYLVAIEQSAVAYLKKQKEKADLYNRDPLTDEVIQLLLRIKTFLTDKRMHGISTYDSIIQDVYGEQIDAVCQKFDTLVKVKKTPLALSNYAKDNKSIYINSNDFETLVKYNAIFGTSKLKDIFDIIPDDPNAFNKMLFDLRQAIQSENERHQEAERQRKQRERELAEQKRKEEEQRKEAERQAELERQEQLKKKIKKVAVIITPIVSALVIFIILLNSVIIPSGNYNKAVDLMNDGKYEDAISAFEALDGYKDSIEQIENCKVAILNEKLENALKLLDEKKYDEAYAILASLGTYANASNEISKSKYDRAIVLYNQSEYDSAILLFSQILNYEDSKDYIEKCNYAKKDIVYNNAIAKYEAQNYEDAKELFSSIIGHRDASQYVTNCFNIISQRIYDTAENYLKNNDWYKAATTFYSIKDYSDAKQRSLSIWRDNLPNSTICTGTIGLGSTTYAVTNTGNVMATGELNKGYGYSDLSGVLTWSNIVSISANNNFVLGLRKNGTVVATGSNSTNQLDVSSWTNIVQVSAGGLCSYGVKSDGTVVASEYVASSSDWRKYNYGQDEVEAWEDIVYVAAGYFHVVALKADGTVVAIGKNDEGLAQCKVDEWKDIVYIAADTVATYGVKADGTVVTTKGGDDVSSWRNIKTISLGDYHTVGLKKDGTVIAVGGSVSDNGELNVSSWRNIVAVFAGDKYTVALKKDGTVVAIGLNHGDGRLGANGWSNIKLP